MDQDVAAAAPVEGVNDAATVGVEVALRAVGREVVEDGAGQEADGGVEALAQPPGGGDGGLGDGGVRVRGGEGAWGGVGECEVAALDVGEQVEGCDGRLDVAGLGTGGGLVCWEEGSGQCCCRGTHFDDPSWLVFECW